MNFTVKVAARTDVGCVRTNNEDNFGYSVDAGVYIVCDGMGGQAAGEVASRMAIESMRDYFQSAHNGHYPQEGKPIEGGSSRANALASAMHRANEAIVAAAQDQAARRGMGATIVAVMVDRHQPLYSIAHAGDSRIYQLRDGQFTQLTNDHSYVMEQVRQGIITLEEAETSDKRNIVTRALGVPDIEPDVDDLMIQPGDQLLLCSDGLTRMLPDDYIRDVLETARTPKIAVDDLIENARDEGGEDNITCMVLKFTQLPWYSRVFTMGPSSGGKQWQSSF